MIAAVRDYGVSLSNWHRMIWLAMRQLFSQYGSGSKVAFLMALLEPLIVITGLYVLRGILKQNTPNYGTSLFLFYASGFLPFYIFLRVSTRARTAQTGPNRILPGLSPLDAYFATVLLNSLIWIMMMVLIFYGMWLYGIDQARPASIATCAAPVLLFIVLGTGVGMINNVISRYLKFWGTFYAVMTRGLVFMSGVIMIVDLKPPWLRELSILFPMSHGIEWVRLGVYGRYPHNSLDESYLVASALIALFLGLVVDRAVIRKLDER